MMSETLTKVKKRNSAIDVVKVVGVLGVLLVHSCAGGYAPIPSSNFLATLFYGCSRRVPLFFMCSGALFLDAGRELPLKKLYSRYILHIALVMLFWGMAYKVYDLHDAQWLTLAGLIQSLKEVLLMKQEFHMYYLQILLIFYAALPIVRLIVHHATEKELNYLLALWFLLAIVYPTLKPFWPLKLLTGIPTQWLVNMTYASIGYGILGWKVKQKPFSAGLSLLLFLGGFALVYGGTVWKSVQTGHLYEGFLEGMSVGVCIMSVGLFSLCLHTPELPPRVAAVFAWLSKGSFCFYLVHSFFLRAFKDLGFTIGFAHPIISIPVYALCNLACGCVVYAVLSHIPVVKRWLV